jgi:nitroreductase
MDFFQAIKSRASVREYQKRAIEAELLETLVDAGRRAPSARAVEPWEFVVITRCAMLKELGSIIAPNGEFIGQAAAGIVVFSRETKYYLEDGCAATENILLAAAASGLGACWIAGDKKPYAGAVAGFLSVPAGMKLVSIISIGWPKEVLPQRKIRCLAEVLHWERFER